MVAHVMRPRVLLYSAILGMIILATAWGLGTRIPLKVDVIRDRATLAREADDGRIENIYTLRIMNTEEAPRRYALSVSGLPGAEIIGERIVEVPAATTESVLVSVRVPPESGTKGANHIFFEIQAQNHDKVRVSEKASFMLP